MNLLLLMFILGFGAGYMTASLGLRFTRTMNDEEREALFGIVKYWPIVTCATIVTWLLGYMSTSMILAGFTGVVCGRGAVCWEVQQRRNDAR